MARSWRGSSPFDVDTYAEHCNTELVKVMKKRDRKRVREERTARVKVTVKRLRPEVLITLPNPCTLCLKTGIRCQVPKSTRYKTCISCKKKKKKCSMKGVVNRLVATGKLGTAEESGNIEILDEGGIAVLGLGRAAELIMSQLVSFQQEVRERLGAIEARLRALEKGGGDEDDKGEDDDNEGDNGNEEDDDDDEDGDGGYGEGDDTMYEGWYGFGDDEDLEGGSDDAEMLD